ncbi:putative inositol monophosphatase protein [Neofusicoccum parvum UCRNP2]|uniref:Inositol-1-monophosphatase n=1 Tax=Botryosphaeria parva (strain UCR-NP2) TaxID=1287680 RepID=R1FY93_BOTPV|nr:putative inositol monophosphatase protein [Neofusicoccum parvum UCRNP2]
MPYSADQSEVSSIIESPASPTSSYSRTNVETPLSSPEASVFDLTRCDDALIESLCNELPLEKIEQTLVSIARRANDMILAADPTVDDSDTKNNSSDRVTATDKAVEDMVYQTLTAAYPDFEFLGEESFKEGTKLTDSPTFVCDPIDGTLNFIHGFPNTAISLALTVGRKPVIGVVLNPFRGDLFTAVKGKGAFLTRHDGRRIQLPAKRNPTPIASLNDCLVAVEWGNQRSGPNWELRTAVHKKLLSSKESGGSMVHSVRSSGSAALDFCYVAAGWIDVFWEAGVWVWDICAGWIILQEAGGIVASTNPGNWEPELEGRCYLAVRGAPSDGQEKVVEELWGLMDGRSFTYPVKK